MDLSGKEVSWVEDPRIGGDSGQPTAEWTAAALAHATILLTSTLILAGGIGLVLGPVAAFAIHRAYRGRSRYVSLHALQSVAYQVAGTMVLSITGAGMASVAVAWRIGGPLIRGVSGALLRVGATPLSLLVASALVGAMLMWLAYGLYAALQVYQGRDFRYWLIGDWVAGEGRE